MESEWSRKRDTCNPDGMETVTVLYNKNLLNALYRYSHCHFACMNALSRAVTPRDSCSTRSSWCVSARSQSFVRWCSNASTRHSAFFHWTLVEIGQNL